MGTSVSAIVAVARHSEPASAVVQRVAGLYLAAVLAAGALIAVSQLPIAIPWPIVFLVLLAGACAASVVTIPLPLGSGRSTLSLSYAVVLGSIMLVGTAQAVVIGAASALTQCVVRSRANTKTREVAFSVATLIIAVQAAGRAYGLFGGAPLLAGGHPASIVVAAAAAATTYFICNTALIAGAIALTTATPLARVWTDHFLWSAPGYYIGAGVAAMAGVLVTHGGFWPTVVCIAPLYVTYRAYRVYMKRVASQVEEISHLHLATVEALALAIDAKDQTTHYHLRRVQIYAVGLARSFNMSEQEIQGVQTAALLHDIGKLAIPEHILSKPGPLTPQEFQKIRTHPEIGAAILASVPFPYPVAPLVLTHHERLDGKGYPAGLSGEQIPLGARILSVADYFDAVMSDRPYHKAMPETEALELIRNESGKAFDPAVVERFIELYPTLSAAAEAARKEESLRTFHPQEPGETPPPAVASARADARAFQQIALAHREIYTLCDIAESMGNCLTVSDTMAVLSSKLTHLVPFTCCALFVTKADEDALACAFATGPDASIVEPLIVNKGDGLVGWAARHGRLVANGDPRIDFEAAGLPPNDRLRSALVAPLMAGDRMIGVLALYHRTQRAFGDDHARLVERVAEQAGWVLFNSIRFEQAQQAALTDALTGLPNRRFMSMYAPNELARTKRLNTKLAVLAIDLNEFKQINDVHGHQTGDDALRAVGHALRTLTRPYDMCVRYAGDEFVLVLTGCGPEEASRRRAELKQAISDIEFALPNGTLLPLAVSVGMAIFPDDGDTLENLLEVADSRMYGEKRGRSTAQQVAVTIRPWSPTVSWDGGD